MDLVHLGSRSPNMLERCFVMLGPPGAGKGTQAKSLARDHGLIYLAAGDILRAIVASGEPPAQTLKAYVDAGDLVPDELVGRIVMGAVDRADRAGGFVLDGFPRTLAQARALDVEFKRRRDPLPQAILIHVPDDELIERLRGRRICAQHGHEYHVKFMRPARAGVCDHDGSALIRRPDDAPATIRRRLSVYHDLTEPLVRHFEQQRRLLHVDGQGEPSEVRRRLGNALAGPTDASHG